MSILKSLVDVKSLVSIQYQVEMSYFKLLEINMSTVTSLIDIKVIIKLYKFSIDIIST